MKNEATKNVAIPDAVHERLKAYAEEKGLVMRVLVAKVLSQYLERVNKKAAA